MEVRVYAVLTYPFSLRSHLYLHPGYRCSLPSIFTDHISFRPTNNPPMHRRMPPRSLLDLPREVIRNIALHIYDPLELTQQDRLSELSRCDM